jgi:hypothetical protein
MAASISDDIANLNLTLVSSDEGEILVSKLRGPVIWA